MNNIETVINKMRSGNPVKIVCLGDSITYGYDSIFSQTEDNYPKNLESELRNLFSNENITVLNWGKNSMTSEWGVSTIDYVIEAERPDIVIVMFGINDVIYKNSPDIYKNNLSIIYNKITAHSTLPIFMTPTPVIGIYKKGVAQYAKYALDFFIANNIFYIDIFTVFNHKLKNIKNPLKFLPDTLHVKNNYRDIAVEIVRKINEFLQEPS